MCLECGCGRVGEVHIDGKPSRESHSPLLAGNLGRGEGSTPARESGAAPGPSSAPDQGRVPMQHAETGAAQGEEVEHGHGHDHPHEHEHEHLHPHGQHTVEVNQAILSKNDRLAERNRGFFKAKGLLVLNVVSAPGSGKTTFIQRTAEALGSRLRVGVIVGDLATDNDAARLRQADVPVVQITTGTVCHLDAEMVARAAARLDLDALDLLIIENVGNLVCPAVYDLGEDLRVVLLSATEGEDKPLKYPPMFHSADVAVVTKIDLAQAAEFDREKALANLRQISHHAAVFELSARTSQGMQAWCDFLVKRHSVGRHSEMP